MLFAAVLGTAAAQQPRPIVIGVSAPLTGALADLGGEYRNGLTLWQEEVNGSGGLLGRQVELRIEDDASDAVKTAELYRKHIAAKVDALIGPYGSAATLMAAAEAETARRVLVSGAGASRVVHKRSPRFVFQAGVPYANYPDGVLQLAKNAGLKRVFLVARDDPVAVEMLEAARQEAERLGLESLEPQTFSAGAVDFFPLILTAAAASADAWLAFAEGREAAEMLKSFKRAGYAPKLFYARGAADPRLIPLVGQDAEFTLASLEYAPRLGTVGNAAFVKAYRTRWKSAPALAAAQGYAAGTVLAAGIRRAGTLDTEPLRAALAAETVATVLGEYRVDPKTGEQVGVAPAVVQILKGRPALVWPADLAEAKPVLPYPQWSDRKLYRPERR